jgi:hypothetical protein
MTAWHGFKQVSKAAEAFLDGTSLKIPIAVLNKVIDTADVRRSFPDSLELLIGITGNHRQQGADGKAPLAARRASGDCEQTIDGKQAAGGHRSGLQALHQVDLFIGVGSTSSYLVQCSREGHRELTTNA